MYKDKGACPSCSRTLEEWEVIKKQNEERSRSSRRVLERAQTTIGQY